MLNASLHATKGACKLSGFCLNSQIVGLISRKSPILFIFALAKMAF